MLFDYSFAFVLQLIANAFEESEMARTIEGVLQDECGRGGNNNEVR